MSDVPETTQQPDVKKVDSVPKLSCDDTNCPYGGYSHVHPLKPSASVMPESPTAREWAEKNARWTKARQWFDVNIAQYTCEDGTISLVSMLAGYAASLRAESVPALPVSSQSAREWAANDSLWTTQETVQSNLEAYASFVTSQTHAALKLAEERAEKAQALLEKIAATVNKLPSITGLSPVRRVEDIPLAIRDLQENYCDASTARNFGVSHSEVSKKLAASEERAEKLAAENERLKKHTESLAETTKFAIEDMHKQTARAEKAEAENAVLRKKGE